MLHDDEYVVKITYITCNVWRYVRAHDNETCIRVNDLLIIICSSNPSVFSAFSI